MKNEIALLAVSERTPTYFDFCMGDKLSNTCCWAARNTFPGITHSGDILHGNDLLDYIRVNEDLSSENDIAIVISGFQYTCLTRFQGSNPVVMVANHEEKVMPNAHCLLGLHILITDVEGSLYCSSTFRCCDDRKGYIVLSTSHKARW